MFSRSCLVGHLSVTRSSWELAPLCSEVRKETKQSGPISRTRSEPQGWRAARQAKSAVCALGFLDSFWKEWSEQFDQMTPRAVTPELTRTEKCSFMRL